MAREVGAIHIHERPKEFAIVGNYALKAFEAIVRADEREIVMNEPINKEHWQRFENEIRADEREACAKVCESFQQDPYEELLYKSDFANAIRARGEAK
jgi:hypothetical protein